MNKPADPHLFDPPDLNLGADGVPEPASGSTDSGDVPELGDHFGSLDAALYSRVLATPLPDPYPIAISNALKDQLGLAKFDLSSSYFTEIFAGNQPWPGSKPLATVYSGHQFGIWAGQLGDGRALLLGDLKVGDERVELQLKGAGRTPYSRGGDGRAVLRSSIREFLCSEAMAALGIPTTRALALVGSAQPVIRETLETAAVVTRVAPSFIRFGSFEHFAAHGDAVRLAVLADQVIDQGYAHLKGRDDRFIRMFEELVERSARLVASWQAVGFCHGVLNTDNMSMLGLTIDYGPFGFLEAFDAGYICNHSDHQGRYAYAAQPQVVHWNLYCLARALMPLIDDAKALEAALATFGAAFDAALFKQMSAKLGLFKPEPSDAELFDELFALLQDNHFDYTLFFRRLGSIHRADQDADDGILDLALDRDRTRIFLEHYRLRLAKEDSDDQVRRLAMNAVNPKYVLRNYLAELAIKDAAAGDFARLARLMTVLARPFDEQDEADDLAQLPPDWARGLEVSCSS